MKTILHSRIYKSTAEDNPPLLILHGLLGVGDNWASMARRYAADGFTTHTIDLPCHGRSPHIKEINIDSFARCVEDYIEYHGMDRAYVIGHSLGGKVAMRLACDSPYIKKLIVADIAPVKYELSSYHRHIFAALNQCCSSFIPSREEASERLSGAGLEDKDIAFLMKSLYHTEDGFYEFRFDFKALESGINSLLAAIDTDKRYEKDTLFIKGGLSTHIIDSHLNEIKTHFPTYEIHTIDNAGHWVHVDAPCEFYDITCNWLKR